MLLVREKILCGGFKKGGLSEWKEKNERSGIAKGMKRKGKRGLKIDRTGGAR